MGTAQNRRLRQLMTDHGLTDQQVGDLVHRTSAYIRELREGKHPVSAPMLRLLELELAHGRGRDLTRSSESIAAQG
jgi:transcriptional regulator with XRE-family HTH domain